MMRHPMENAQCGRGPKDITHDVRCLAKLLLPSDIRRVFT